MSKLYVISGPEKGRTSDLVEGTTYVGRSPENDFQIADSYVSRRHLKIVRRSERTFITDLGSRNGVLIEGKRIGAGVEVEVKEGVPIVIGMSVICLGEECSEYLKAYPGPFDLAREVYEDGMVLAEDRPMTGKKNKELIQRVSETLTGPISVDEILDKIAGSIFEILERIHRVAIILIDPETGAVAKAVSRTARNVPEAVTRYSREVVDRVIRDGESFVVSNVETQEVADLSETLKLLKIGSVMCVPLIGERGVRGVIYMDSIERANAFRKEDVSLFTALGRQTISAIDQALAAGRAGGFATGTDSASRRDRG